MPSHGVQDHDELLVRRARDDSAHFDGRIALTEHVAGRGSVTLMSAEPGDVFGWTALIPPYRATATVVSLEPVKVIAIEAEAPFPVTFEMDWNEGEDLEDKLEELVIRSLVILGLLAVISIGIGLWAGIQGKSQEAVPGYPDLGGDFTLQAGSPALKTRGGRKGPARIKRPSAAK